MTSPFSPSQSLPPRFDRVQRAAFAYLETHANPTNGLTCDTSEVGAPASVGVTGMALTALCVGVERGFIKRPAALNRALATLRFFAEEAPGCGGFFYHFLTLDGEREWKCEVSTVDSGFLFYGALAVAAYFGGDAPRERAVRELCDRILQAADWRWAADGQTLLHTAWKPGTGFAKSRWAGYNEGLLLYPLAVGAESGGLQPQSYDDWLANYRYKISYGYPWAYCGPLFTHLFPHLWMDLRHTTDRWMREHKLNYWENTRNAVAVQREFARRQFRGKPGYTAGTWGLSACDGPHTPGHHDGYWNYRARGAPCGPNDGTLSPPAALGALAFDFEGATEAAQAYEKHAPDLFGEFGVRGGFNPGADHWMSGFYGLDQGMLCLGLENARSGLIWELLRSSPQLVRGLGRCGFSDEVGAESTAAPSLP